jgi:hypothetical protein
MSEHPVLSLAGVLGLAVSVLTGVGTVIGWIVSESFWDALFVALQVAGAIFYIAGGAGCALVAINGKRMGYSIGTRLAALFGAIFIALVVVAFMSDPEGLEDEDWSLAILGLIGIGLSLTYPAIKVLDAHERYRQSRRECPACAETIKRRAGVCKHCGYRLRWIP